MEKAGGRATPAALRYIALQSAKMNHVERKDKDGKLIFRNNWDEYPRVRPASGKPLFDTGNREGWEEIRDGSVWVGKKIGRGLGLAKQKLSKLFKGNARAGATKANADDPQRDNSESSEDARESLP